MEQSRPPTAHGYYGDRLSTRQCLQFIHNCSSTFSMLNERIGSWNTTAQCLAVCIVSQTRQDSTRQGTTKQIPWDNSWEERLNLTKETKYKHTYTRTNIVSIHKTPKVTPTAKVTTTAVGFVYFVHPSPMYFKQSRQQMDNICAVGNKRNNELIKITINVKC